MGRSRGTRLVLGARVLPATAFAAVVGLLLFQTPAAALDVTGTPSPVTGNATYFSGLGAPYGGCGVPQANLDSQDFVALNVFNTPGDYATHPRPVPASQSGILGMFDNGLNCDRYVQVTIGDYCTGTNDGAQSQPFCRNGSWVGDRYNGATLTMLVADSCADSNAWCRDDPHHLDLHQDSLSRFVSNGAPVGSGLADHWNNRHISWQFVPTPNYTGDIQIGFLQGAQTWWGATAISHLPNGIHGVQYYANGAWTNAAMDGDMGQAYVLSPTTSGGSQFQIRVLDADDTLVNNGRVYTFSLPASCSGQCSAPYTQVSYTTGDGGGGTTTTTPPPSSTTPPPGGCTATESITSTWSGGFQAAVTVTNTGTTPTTSWTVDGAFPGSQTLVNSWNATVTQSGARLSARNAGYNGTIAAGGSTSWGMTVNGADQALTNLTCRAA
ncbi:cellulose binding domain-containing protein [Kutzneria sp. NPDC051319]|uniref:cellulose binding domain-containing protein n=1 Tax=Kutzneria sp. NPDC051319 TaxID=3155047 RepID=UPI003418C89E